MGTGQIRIRHRLLTKLLVSHILLASLPIAITGAVLVTAARNFIEATILERNLEIARRTAQQITVTLHHAQDILRSVAQNPILTSNSRLAQELIINRTVKQFDIFRKIVLIDRKGNQIATTAYGRPRKSYASEEFFTRAVGGESYSSPIYVSEEKLPYLILAEPLWERNEIQGVLMAEVHLKAMWALVEQSAIGKKGQAFLFDGQGVFLAHSDRRRVYLKERLADRGILENVKLGLAGQKVYIDDEGTEMISAYVPLGEIGWGIVIQQPTHEAFAPARKMRLQVYGFVVLSILAASLIAFISSRRVAKPVDRLVSGLERFSRGELDFRLKPLGQDEIGTLSVKFNEMADRISEFQVKLQRAIRLEMMGRLASILSHEIRNPLNAMVINMQIMKREMSKHPLNVEKIERYYQIVVSEIKRIDQLVTNFLIVARPPKLEKQRLCIDEVLEEVILMQQPDSARKGIKVAKDYRQKGVAVMADRDKMKQVFLNLYLNATEAMAPGGLLTIGLDVIDRQPAEEGFDKRSVVVRFADTGTGIDPEHLPHIFDFYFSTKEKGTGLGLPVAQQIVEEHGGKIIVKSRVGVGSTFSIFLPLSDHEKISPSP